MKARAWISAALVLISLAPTAFAQRVVPQGAKLVRKRKPPPPNRTEYFWQPLAGHVAVQAGYSAMSYATDLNSLGGFKYGTLSSSSSGADIAIAYGLSDSTTLSLAWSPTATVKQETAPTGLPSYTQNRSGFGDARLGLLTAIELDSLMSYVGFQAGIPITQAKSPRATQNAQGYDTADGNMSSGGYSLAASAGLLLKLSEEHRFGGRAQYRYLFSRSFDTQDGTTSTTTGGSDFDLTGFYEMRNGAFVLSPLIDFDLTDASVSTSSGRNSTSDPATTTTLTLETGYYFSRAFFAAASAFYAIKQESKVGSFLYGYKAPGAALSLRYEF